MSEAKEKREHEELNSLVLQHMEHRDKMNLLSEREPVPKRMKKLEFLHCQILQCRKDKLEFEREIRLSELVFQEHEKRFVGERAANANELHREKSEALRVNEYKELYKMEMLKKEEEQREKELERHMVHEELVQKEKGERLRQEQLLIETLKTIEDKEEDFKQIQQATLLQHVGQLQHYVTNHEEGQNYLSQQIEFVQEENAEKKEKLKSLK